MLCAAELWPFKRRTGSLTITLLLFLAVHHFLPGDFPQIFWNLFCLSGEYILSRAIPGFDEAD
ncbi:MAG: hypothetical protein DMF76_18405 [Acidobacteria bacterium]|nr:MAG: hypothetical protein DMF76_18405 [Acidobacteriota bacterium]